MYSIDDLEIEDGDVFMMVFIQTFKHDARDCFLALQEHGRGS